MNPSASHRSAGGTLFIIAILPAFNLIGQKETLVCNGKIYSETHKQKFEVREATFKIDKNLANDSKLTLTINKQPISDWFKGNHTIFRHANFIGCLSADKIKMPVRKYFCFNIPVYRNMAEEPSCRSPYHEEYIQTSVSGNSEGLCRSTYSFLSERR